MVCNLTICAFLNCRSNTFIWGEDVADHPTLQNIPVHMSLAEAATAAATDRGGDSSPAAKRQRT
jgi:hypothetical protein